MHELSLCQNIINIVLNHIPTEKKVTQIHLALGQLVAVDKNALQFNFEILARNTLISTASLQINEIIAEARCDRCYRVFQLNQRYDACNMCGSHALTILKGEEFLVQSIEVE